MGSQGTSQQSSQQNVTQTQLPPWVNQAAQQNYALAQNIANRPLTQYGGQQVADVGPQTQQGWNLAAQSGNAGADQYNASQAGYLNAMGTPATQVNPVNMNASLNTGPTGAINPQTLAGANLSAYTSPYTQQVINSTLPLMQQQLGQQQIGNQSQAAGAGAYGGSRQGIQQGVTQAQGALNMANMAAQLNQQGYQQAVQGAQYDIGNNMAAQQANVGAANQFALANQQMQQQANQANQGVGMTAQTANQQANQANINSMLQGATGMGGLGNQAQQNQRQQFLELSTAGAQEQQQQQNQINAQIGQFNNAWQYPGQQLSVLQSALGMTPYGQTTMGTSSGQQQTQTQQGFGDIAMGGLQSLGGMFGQGGPFAAGGALAGLMPGSDAHLKTDITPVGVHPATGLPLYSYRYKGDPKSYPKITGPMAEDAMQLAPHAVKTVGVHQPTGQALHQVDMNALDAAGPAGPQAQPAGMPVSRPRRMPGANDAFTTRVPGPLAPTTPTGLTGAMGASMRPPRMRRPVPAPMVPGGLAGGFGG